MTLKEALDRTTAYFKRAGIPDARLDAEYLVAEAAGIPRLRLSLCGGQKLSFDGEHQLAEWIHQRLERRPLAYVLGEQPFMDLTLRVNPSVLIPRPETELLVEQAGAVLDRIRSAVVVDVGTGSGNIALCLARHPNAAEVHAIDISGAALDLARENALRNRIPQPIHWHLGDLLTPLMDRRDGIDLIVANLPYVRTSEMPALAPEIRWEPPLALDGGRDGLAYVYQLIDQAQHVLKPDGILLLEIGADQALAVIGTFGLDQGPWEKPMIYSDLAGLPRIVRIQKGNLVGSPDH